jgi:diguanylate cyclase (GGDEF)-like protein
MINPRVQGLGLLCDLQGMILRVLKNDLDLENAQPGQLFLSIMESGSRTKAMNFMTELKAAGAALDWEMNVPATNGFMNLHFAGGVAAETMLITAATNGSMAEKLCEEMLLINNEQTNHLRSALKNSLGSAEAPSDLMYNEISQLNNELVAMQRELAGKNAELKRLYADIEKLAVTDPLTGLYNRRGFFEKSDFELERAKRYGHALGSIMFDLDHFKKVNDTYGHAIGDLVLKEMAARFIPLIRKVDVFGRYGGEEFALILPETNLEKALVVAERLRHAAREPIQTEQGILNITISMGISELKRSTTDVQSLLNCADQALYQAKEAGRDRVCVEQQSEEAASA